MAAASTHLSCFFAVLPFYTFHLHPTLRNYQIVVRINKKTKGDGYGWINLYYNWKEIQYNNLILTNLISWVTYFTSDTCPWDRRFTPATHVHVGHEIWLLIKKRAFAWLTVSTVACQIGLIQLSLRLVQLSSPPLYEQFRSANLFHPQLYEKKELSFTHSPHSLHLSIPKEVWKSDYLLPAKVDTLAFHNDHFFLLSLCVSSTSSTI